MTEERRYYERLWLNKHDRAHIIASIEDEGEYKDQNYYSSYVEAYFDIADCTHSVSLDFCFDASDQKDFEKQIKKVNTLLDSLTVFKEKMIQRKIFIEEQHKKFKAKEAK